MAKRNLNEVLGFISRWGDSRFSSRLMESEASPQEEMDALDKRIKLLQTNIWRTTDVDSRKILSAEISKLKREKTLKGVDAVERQTEWETKEKEAAKAEEDEAAVENAASTKPLSIKERLKKRWKDTETDDPAKNSILSRIGRGLKDIGIPNIGIPTLSGGIDGKDEKPSLSSRALGKLSDITGKAGEIQGMLGAVSGMGASVGQGIIKMSRAQTGRRQDMGANVGGFTQATSAIASGLDRISVGADRLEDESQIKQATQKIEAQMRSLRANRGNLSAEQQKIAAERYKQLERARQDARSKNRFTAARLQRMLDLLGTGRTTPTKP